MYPKTGLFQGWLIHSSCVIKANSFHLSSLLSSAYWCLSTGRCPHGHKIAAEAPGWHPHMALRKGQEGKASSLASIFCFFFLWHSHNRINDFELYKSVVFSTFNVVRYQVRKRVHHPKREPLYPFLRNVSWKLKGHACKSHQTKLSSVIILKPGLGKVSEIMMLGQSKAPPVQQPRQHRTMTMTVRFLNKWINE